jgi:hypothetical protein
MTQTSCRNALQTKLITNEIDPEDQNILQGVAVSATLDHARDLLFNHAAAHAAFMFKSLIAVRRIRNVADSSALLR